MTQFLTWNFVGAASPGTSLESAAAQAGVSWSKHGSYSSGSAAVGATNGIYNSSGGVDSVYYPTGLSVSGADYDVVATVDFVSLESGSEVGIWVRLSTSANTGYLGAYDRNMSQFSLTKFVNGTTTVLATYSVGYTQAGSHAFQVSARGTSISMVVDGVQVANVIDSAISAAGVPGLWLQSAPAGDSDATGMHLLNVSAGTAVFAPDYPGVLLSPGNSIDTPGVSVAWIDPGYMRFNVFGTSVGVTYDVTALRAASVSSGNFPALVWSIDGSAWQSEQFPATSNTGTIWMGVGMSQSLHSVEIRYQVNDESGTWVPSPSVPPDTVLITGIVTDLAFAAVSAPTGAAAPRSNAAAFFGASITRGAKAQNLLGGTDLTELARQTWPVLLAYAINAEYCIVGKSGQGFAATATDGSPAFSGTLNYYFQGKPRNWPALTDVFVEQGINDGSSSSATVTVAATTAIGAIRSRVGPTCKISVLVPINGTQRAAILAGVSAYQSANPTDLLVRPIDPSPYWFAVQQYTADTIHPTNEGHARYATLLAGLYCQAWGSPTAQQVAMAALTASAGAGRYPIDHDGGIGLAGANVSAVLTATGATIPFAANMFQYVAGVGGNPVSGVPISAYLKSAYDAATGSGFQGATTTGAAGQWTSPLLLNSGVYYLLFGPTAGEQVLQVTLTVP